MMYIPILIGFIAAMRSPVESLHSATKEGWADGARALTPEIIALAERIYGNITFVPTSEGGFQLEFHAGGLDVEIEIDGDGQLESFYISRGRVSQ